MHGALLLIIMGKVLGHSFLYTFLSNSGKVSKSVQEIVTYTATGNSCFLPVPNHGSVTMAIITELWVVGVI